MVIRRVVLIDEDYLVMPDDRPRCEILDGEVAVPGGSGARRPWRSG